MDEENFSELLENWQLGHLLENFQNNGIGSQNFKWLKESHVRLLNLSIGDEARVLHCIDRMQNEKGGNKENEKFTASPSTSSQKRPCTEPNWFSGSLRNESLVEEPQQKKSKFTLLFNVVDMLESDIYLRAILKYYSNAAALNDKYRKAISTQCAKMLIDQYGNKIPMEAYIETRNQILAIFPSEERASWFEPPCKGRDQHESVGCLYYRVKHLRSELQAMGYLELLRRHKKAADSTPRTSSVLEEKILLLAASSFTGALNELTSLWTETRQLRFADFQATTDLVDLERKYGILFNSQFVQILTSLDFEELFCFGLQEEQESLDRWRALTLKVASIVEKKKAKVNKDFCSKICNKELSDEIRDRLIIWSLGQLWSAPPATKKSIKLNKNDVSDRLLLCVEDESSISERLSSLLHAQDHCQRPLIVALGQSIETSKQIFVALSNSILLPVNSAFEGVLLAFKFQAIFKGLNFDDSIAFIWNILEKVVFQTNIFKKCSSKISKIVSDLKSYCDSVGFEFTSQIYTLPIPRTTSSQILNLTHNMIASLHHEVIMIAQELSNQLKHPLSTELLLKLTIIDNTLAKYTTEAKVISSLDTFVAPQKDSIRIDCLSNIPKHMTSSLTSNLPKVFKLFFELPGILDLALSFQNYCSQPHNTTFHWLQSEAWKNLKLKNLNAQNSLLIPIFLYYDDFVGKNPLGSHKMKLGGTYVSLPTFPPEMEQKISNIFLAKIFYTQLKTLLGHKESFSSLVDIFNLLQSNGIQVVALNGLKMQLHFQLSLLLGDNLGVNALGGFVESFLANFFCRYCLVSKAESQTLCCEMEEKLRTIDNYNFSLFQGDSSLSGVKESSVLNLCNNFHVINNIAVDVMHDIFEGIARYEMKFVISELVCAQFFSIAQLNDRLNEFFSSADFLNVPPPFSSDTLRGETILMSAAEMYNLIIFFGPILGDLVPVGNPIWKLYLLLKEIVLIVMVYEVQTGTPSYLQRTIEKHHKMYLNLSPNNKLKPKHHIILHYPRLMSHMGPLRNFSSFRFESYHREAKKVTRNTNNAKNIPLTVTTKVHLDLAFKFKNSNFMPPKTLLGPEIVDNKKFLQENFPNCDQAVSAEIENLCAAGYRILKSFDFRCITYSLGNALVLDFDSFGPNFSIISALFFNGDKCIALVNCLESNFVSHTQSYDVSASHTFKKLDLEQIPVRKPLPVYHMSRGRMIICPKRML